MNNAVKIVLCNSCGTQNKILPNKGNYKCGKCKNILLTTGTSHSIILLKILGRHWFWLLVFSVIIVLNLPSDKKDKYDKIHSKNYNRIIQSEVSTIQLPPAVPIKHGEVLKPFSSKGVAPLEVKTNFGANYFIKLIDVDTKQIKMSAFIEGGKAFTILVPLGSYQLKYATGQVWMGENHYFGPNGLTSYSKTNAIFDFTKNHQGYSGYTVELILQSHGNLSTEQILSDDF
jgi:hypothetical protein